MDLFAMIPFVVTSLFIRLFKKDKEKSIALLFSYIKGLMILIVVCLILSML